MYKVVWFARFVDGMTRDEARRHWRDVHGPLGGKVPQVVEYVQSHAVDSLDDEAGPGFDGYSCCWFDDGASFAEALRTPEWADLGADGGNVFDMDWFTGMSAALDERVIVDGDYGPFKTVWVVRFKDEIRRDSARRREAHEHWIATHGEHLGRAVPGIGRYVQNHCAVALGAEGEDEGVELLFDGFSECWFESREAFERVTSSREWLAMSDDADLFCDVDYIRGMSAVVEENAVKGGRELARA